MGGCVRDLLLNRVPKDFDVITTADLREVMLSTVFSVPHLCFACKTLCIKYMHNFFKQIKKQFHRAFVIGRRFPICKVLVRGSAVEVGLGRFRGWSCL